ncbi:hypothetical protein CPG38_01785 [Malaciobacter marinus]|uniref:hypothetical protein n=1 Tax=Malaciobacter marinus TaxID=505249 RepID=UPI000C079233|nr:hypothetical protein [Malaciobacter marinus]PHO13747.1 hypothetical protein CPG38_01785 [Malaciobacter marinus]
MIFLIISLLRDYKYKVNEDNCSQFIQDLIYRIDSDQREQVKNVKKLMMDDKERNNDIDNEMGR